MFSDSTELADVPLDCQAPAASLGTRSRGSGIAGGLLGSVTPAGTMLPLFSSLLPWPPYVLVMEVYGNSAKCGQISRQNFSLDQLSSFLGSVWGGGGMHLGASLETWKLGWGER